MNFWRTELRSIDAIHYDAENPGYITAGSVQGAMGNKRKVYVLRTDSYGSKIWEKTYYYEGGAWEHCQAFSVQETTDEGFIVAGCVQYGQQTDLYLMKRRQQAMGKIYGGPGLGTGATRSARRAMAATRCGQHTMQGRSSYQTNASGGMTWQKIFDKARIVDPCQMCSRN